MNSTHALVLSVVAIMAGTLLLLFGKSEVMAGAMITSGLAGTVGAATVAKKQATVQRHRAEDAEGELSRTQFNLRRVLREQGVPPPPPTS